ncbi:DUF11 domain-containing protein [Patescibacteria group bacterium]|nr:DUF11 domain-containing protein [Patescibacteria group bacterium]
MKFFNLVKIAVLVAGGVFLGSTKVAMAQYYGNGEEQRQIVVDKKIRIMPDGKTLDNIDKDEKVFYEKDELEFSVYVKNTGETKLTNIKAKDWLPQGLSLYFFPGNYNKDTGEIEWTIDELGSGESKTYLIRARIEKSDSGQKTNKAEAKNDQVSDSDTASYFVGEESVPETGDASLIVKSIMVAITAGSALGLRKYARGY